MRRLLASPLIAVVIGVLACGTSATEAPPTAAPTPSPTVTPAPMPQSESSSTVAPALTPPPSPSLQPTPIPTNVPARTAIIVDQPEAGTSVGKTIPHFEFTLADGTKQSTAQLSSQGQPVFLFFFATW